MNLLAHLRLIFILILVFVSLFTILSPLLVSKTGVIVTKVDPNVVCNNIQEGDTIIFVGGDLVKNSQHFKAIESSVKKDVYVAMKVNTGPGGCVAPRDGNLGIEVRDIRSDFIKFGSEFSGGYEFVLKSNSILLQSDLKQISQTIQKRIESMSLAETTVKTENDFIVLSSPNQDYLSNLISKGNIETSILYPVKIEISNSTTIGKIKIGSNSHELILSNKSVIFNGTIYSVNEIFFVENIPHKIVNITENSVVFDAKIFDIENMSKTGLARSFVSFVSEQNAYQFSVPYELSQDGQENLMKLLRGLDRISQGNSIVLNGLLTYRIDEKEISRLGIPADFEFQNLRILSILGFTSSSQSANEMMRYLNSVISSGSINTKLTLEQTRTIQPKNLNFGVNFIIISTLGFASALVLISKFRYKKLSPSMYFIFILVSEFIILFAMIVNVQRNFGSMTIDTTMLYSFFIVMMISLIEMITIAEEKVKLKTLGLKIGSKQIARLRTFLIVATIAVGFVLMFTQFRTLGLLMIPWIILSELVTKPYLTKHL